MVFGSDFVENDICDVRCCCFWYHKQKKTDNPRRKSEPRFLKERARKTRCVLYAMLHQKVVHAF